MNGQGTCTDCRLGPCGRKSRKCDGLNEDIEQMTEGVEEGFYSPETLTWKDAQGGSHSQRCNARKLAENGHTASDQPDYY